eukprot:3109231-Prymnesium_polylepis.1
MASRQPLSSIPVSAITEVASATVRHSRKQYLPRMSAEATGSPAIDVSCSEALIRAALKKLTSNSSVTAA